MKRCVGAGHLARGRVGTVPGHGPGPEFHPAFRDERSGVVYLSRREDGSPAPVHLMEGLPDALVSTRDSEGRAIALRVEVTAGYVRDGRFLTRDEAENDAEPRRQRG